MSTQPVGRTPAPVTAAAKSRTARTAGPGRFAAELGGMCAVMCLGGAAVAFVAAGWLGYPGLAQQAPGLSALVIAVPGGADGGLHGGAGPRTAPQRGDD